MLKKFLILFIFFMLVNTSFAEDVTQQCRDTQFQRAGEPLPVKIVGSCVGALAGGIAEVVDQGASGEKDVDWLRVGVATASGATKGFVQPIETMWQVAPAIWAGLAIGTADKLYKENKEQNK